MTKKEDSEYSIEQFTLKKKNFDEITNLLNDAFLTDEAAIEEGATITFTKESFDLFFNSPITDPDLFVRAIHKPTNQIVGFLGNIPRTVSLFGEKYNFIIPGWLSVAPDHRRQGIATLMGRKLLELVSNSEKYEGGFALFEPEQYGKDITRIVVSSSNLKQVTVYSTKKFVVRAFSAKKLSEVVKLKWYEKLAFRVLQGVKEKDNPRIRLFEKKDTEALYKLILEYEDRCDLAVIHDKEDFARIVNHPLFLCVVHENDKGEIDGFIGVWEFLLSGFGKTYPFGWLDMVHIYQITTKEAKELCNFLCVKAKERGWIGIQCPYFPYYDSKPFIKAKFIFYTKRLFLDMGMLKGMNLPRKIESIFLDWR